MCCRRDAGQEICAPASRRTFISPGRGRIESDCSADDPVLTTCLVGGKVPGVPHVQGLKHVALDVHVLGLAGDLLEKCPEDDEADVGVVEDLTGIECQRRGECTPDALGLVGLVQSPRTGHAEVARQARGVGEQHA